MDWQGFCQVLVTTIPKSDTIKLLLVGFFEVIYVWCVFMILIIQNKESGALFTLLHHVYLIVCGENWNTVYVCVEQQMEPTSNYTEQVCTVFILFR